MAGRIDDLAAHESNLAKIGDCLSLIEKDSSSLSDETKEALQKAQQYVRGSVHMQTVKAQQTGLWLHKLGVSTAEYCV